VLGEAASLEQARLMLARAAQLVLANGLTLLGIAAPERM
jgi:arginyl-tRNA synthetase